VVTEPLSRDTALALSAVELREHGARLFAGKFTDAEGRGRPMSTQAIVPTKRRRAARAAWQRLSGPDAGACGSCHNEPVLGGAGDFATNAFVSEGFTNPDFDTLDPQFSNERGTNHLFGAGFIELLAREMTVELQAQRRAALNRARVTGEPVKAPLLTKDVAFGTLIAFPDGTVDVAGVEGVDPDLVVRPFGQKGVITSLRNFTINAANAHHGMQAVERFGARWTGEADFDEDGVADELGTGDVTALTVFQASLPPPAGYEPENPAWRAAAARGARRFETIGCASCHRPTLPLESTLFTDPGPFDLAGTLRAGDAEPLAVDLAPLAEAAGFARDEAGRWLIPVSSDLKRHPIADEQVAALGNELLAQRFVAADTFLTAELWGVADTAPYGHRGNLDTLDAAIRAHGGSGRKARDAYAALSDKAKDDVIAYLRTFRTAP
jgi:cytochrome c peroxidase